MNESCQKNVAMSEFWKKKENCTWKCTCTCSRALLSELPLMLPWDGDGDGGRECWGGYLFFRWSMKASRLRSSSALCRLLSASRLWAAITVCRCSDVCTRPTLEKRRAPFPRLRYSRGYSRSSVEIMWPPPRSGSKWGRQEDKKRKKNRCGFNYTGHHVVNMVHTKTKETKRERNGMSG